MTYCNVLNIDKRENELQLHMASKMVTTSVISKVKLLASHCVARWPIVFAMHSEHTLTSRNVCACVCVPAHESFCRRVIVRMNGCLL